MIYPSKENCTKAIDIIKELKENPFLGLTPDDTNFLLGFLEMAILHLPHFEVSKNPNDGFCSTIEAMEEDLRDENK